MSGEPFLTQWWRDLFALVTVVLVVVIAYYSHSLHQAKSALWGAMEGSCDGPHGASHDTVRSDTSYPLDDGRTPKHKYGKSNSESMGQFEPPVSWVAPGFQSVAAGGHNYDSVDDWEQKALESGDGWGAINSYMASRMPGGGADGPQFTYGDQSEGMYGGQALSPY